MSAQCHDSDIVLSYNREHVAELDLVAPTDGSETTPKMAHSIQTEKNIV